MLTNSQTGKGESIYWEPFGSQALNSTDVAISSFYRQGNGRSASKRGTGSKKRSPDSHRDPAAPRFRRATPHSFLPPNHPRSPAGGRLWARITEVLRAPQTAPGGTATSSARQLSPGSCTTAAHALASASSLVQRGRRQNAPSSRGGRAT